MAANSSTDPARSCVYLPAMASIPRPPQGHFNVLYFAAASSYTSKQYDALPAPLPLENLFAALEEKYSGIKEKILDTCLVTINLDYVDMPQESDEDAIVIKEGDEVAIIPPVSSG
jgi:molybdopterin synthase sulfur carrier subunit